MSFIKVESVEVGKEYLAQALISALNKNQRVAWLVSGGSNARLASDIRHALPPEQLKYLEIALVDERYGKPGHSDSNITKLQQAGFDFSGVSFTPVLTSDDLSFEQTTINYRQRIAELFERSDVVIGQFGIGSDGHTAGILPHSEAAVSDERLVIGYEGPDFKRITQSFTAIARLDTAYVFAFGKDKLEALESLHDKDLPLSDQPAQIFRQYGLKSFIINNMIGDNA